MGNEIKKIKQIIAILLIIVSVPFFVIGVPIAEISFVTISIFLIWLGLLLYNFRRDRAMIVAFLITFFAFLLGEVFVNIFDSTMLYTSNKNALFHTYCCLYISLLFLHFGTLLGKKKFVFGNHFYKKNSLVGRYQRSIDYTSVRTACKILYLVFGVCDLAQAVEKLMISAFLGSYTATFINYKSFLPGIVLKCATMADMVFFLYLATLPNPKKSKFVFGLKLLISLVLLAFGTRSAIMMTLLIMAIYCIYYENVENCKYEIIPRKVYVLTVICLPLVLLFFDFLMSYRDGRNYTFSNIGNSVKHIVSSMGGSINVITYGYEYNAVLPNRVYSFGGIIDFFTQNIFSRLIFGVQQYGGNTVEMALYGNSFSNALTFLVRRWDFLNGYGMGSSYIAEVFHDFGYVGIMLINLLYGIILTAANKLQMSKFVKNAIVLMASYYILVAPRAYADGFISCFFNFSFILTVLAVYIVTIFIRNITNRRRYK